MAQISKHFDRREFACHCGCGFDTVDTELLVILEDLRDRFNRPIYINSGCRCKKRNARVLGSKRSMHLWGKAADIEVDGVEPREVANYLERRYIYRYGIGRYPTFTHVDSRDTKARWNET
jgi:uncharacterized protein YcbK (DUF882 family)